MTSLCKLQKHSDNAVETGSYISRPRSAVVVAVAHDNITISQYRNNETWGPAFAAPFVRYLAGRKRWSAAADAGYLALVAGLTACIYCT
ncbi:hypothetical protein GMOD_00003962 [Pyrenophora seminiperda CCB06]|uniref:Uncharacterized protein n=1 Tax=Pyrenophora seminiperda CCB06 TaxID=1302712 RepID=A0A3M7M0H4_9PLEO|nr:hypothetical protein GMOD_00003962 [Pyrenophora seminiperda CCB06]